MFSEYIDDIEKPVDNMVNKDYKEENEESPVAKDKNEEEKVFPVNEEDNNENNNKKEESGNGNIENKTMNKAEDGNTKKTLEDVNSKISQYWGFFDEFPNARHEDNSQLSIGEKFHEAMASEIGGITEKKIKGFDRNLKDGRHAEVREEGGQIYLKITQEGKDGKNKELSISLNNFEPRKSDKKNDKDIIQPTISISGDESLLNDLLGNNYGNKNIPEGGNIINNILTMEKNPELFKKVFDSVHEDIISKEIQDFHGYVDHAKNIIDSENFSEFLLQQDNWRNPERGLDSNSFVEYLITCIEEGKIGEKTLDTQDLMACRVLLSLCILLRNSSNNIQTIKESLGYDEEENIGKEKTIQGGENLIEFLPINEADLKKFIACRDEVIKLALQELTKEQDKLLSTENILDSNYTKKGGEITRLLNCLNK